MYPDCLLLVLMFGAIIRVVSNCSENHTFYFKLLSFKASGKSGVCEGGKRSTNDQCDISFQARVVGSEDNVTFNNGNNKNEYNGEGKEPKELWHHYDLDDDNITLVIQFLEDDIKSNNDIEIETVANIFNESFHGNPPANNLDICIYKLYKSFDKQKLNSPQIALNLKFVVADGKYNFLGNCESTGPDDFNMELKFEVEIERIDCTTTTPLTTAETTTSTSSSSSTSTTSTTSGQPPKMPTSTLSSVSEINTSTTTMTTTPTTSTSSKVSLSNKPTPSPKPLKKRRNKKTRPFSTTADKIYTVLLGLINTLLVIWMIGVARMFIT